MRHRIVAPWPRRVAGLGLVWVLTAAVLTWAGSHPSWVGTLTVLAALAGLAWFLTDIGGDHAAPGWTTERDIASERATLDGRLGALRRLAETAGEPPPDGGATRPAAAEIQGLLRRAADLRAAASGGAMPEELATYLSADPAPLLSPTRIDHLLTQIEEL